MARIRMVKPDLRESEKVASWPREVRYFWVLLWGYVDDHGKGKDNPLLVKADCFPLDVDVDGAVVDEWLWMLEESGVIARYEVGGQRLIEVVNWSEHQKPQHPKPDVLPGHKAPGAVLRKRDELFTKPSRQPHEVLTPGLGWVGLESEEGLSLSAPASGGDVKPKVDYFLMAYEAWPKKTEKAEGARRWARAVKAFGRSEAELVEVVRQFGAAYAANVDRQYTPSLAVWLHRERWTDELPQRHVEPRRMTNNEHNLAFLQDLAREHNSEPPHQRLEIGAS